MTTIVTLGMDTGSAAWFEAQRRQYYPPALNRIPAHLSLFHALPGDASIRHVLREAASASTTFRMQVTGLRSMGRGVLYGLESPELMRLHAGLVNQFRTFLIPQDKQPLRPHVVVQNKVEPAEAKALLAKLEAQFSPREVQAVGLDWWEYLGGPWRHLERFDFAGAAGPVPDAESAAPAEPRVQRVHSLTPEAQKLLEEYYKAASVVQRDTEDAVQQLLKDEHSAMWLAYQGDELAGCVLMRAGVPEPGAGECKRLYVRPACRRGGVAAALMDALEAFARTSGLQWVYLDTNDAFAASIALYQHRGYRECARYNDNPQATTFLRKPL